MPRQGTMAGFATYTGVLALALDLDDFGVASLARLAAGELDGAGSDLVHRARPEVPVLAELGRDHEPSHHQEGNHA